MNMGLSSWYIVDGESNKTIKWKGICRGKGQIKASYADYSKKSMCFCGTAKSHRNCSEQFWEIWFVR